MFKKVKGIQPSRHYLGINFPSKKCFTSHGRLRHGAKSEKRKGGKEQLVTSLEGHIFKLYRGKMKKGKA